MPEWYGADAVAREIILERERRLAKRQLLTELPSGQTTAITIHRKLAGVIGGQLVRAGEWLRSYGQSEFTGEIWVGHSQAREPNA